jgi:hypothetical protein
MYEMDVASAVKAGMKRSLELKQQSLEPNKKLEKKIQVIFYTLLKGFVTLHYIKTHCFFFCFV